MKTPLNLPLMRFAKGERERPPDLAVHRPQQA